MFQELPWISHFVQVLSLYLWLQETLILLQFAAIRFSCCPPNVNPTNMNPSAYMTLGCEMTWKYRDGGPNPHSPWRCSHSENRCSIFVCNGGSMCSVHLTSWMLSAWRNRTNEHLPIVRYDCLFCSRSESCSPEASRFCHRTLQHPSLAEWWEFNSTEHFPNNHHFYQHV